MSGETKDYSAKTLLQFLTPSYPSITLAELAIDFDGSYSHPKCARRGIESFLISKIN